MHRQNLTRLFVALCGWVVAACVTSPSASGLLYYVEDREGRELRSHEPQRSINPASVVKVGTTLWALERKGAGHRFDTEFQHRGEIDRERGRLVGDLLVRGGKDPDFHVENAYLVARRLNELGIREVSGSLVVDHSFWIGWEGGSERRIADPERRAAEMARRLAKALDSASWDEATRKSIGEFEARRGFVAADRPRVRIAGSPRVANPGESGVPLLVHRSNPLFTLLKRFNAFSNNDIERLGNTLGPASALTEFLNERVEPDVDFRTLSGLGRNRATPRALVRLVRELDRWLVAHDLALEDLLPATGCDPGTFDNYRALADLEPTAVVGKTGSLIETDGGVAVFAGRARGPEGERWFALVSPESGKELVRARSSQGRFLREGVGVSSGPEDCGQPVVHSDHDARIAVPERPTGHDWPSFLGARGEARSDETGWHLDWNERPPVIAWELELGEGYSAPSVADGRIFVFDRVGNEARLRALSAGTGESLWSASYETRYEDIYKFSNGPRTSPVIDGKRVFTFGVEGRLRAHAVEDGRLLWDVDTTERFSVVTNFFGVGSTPVVYGDSLIAMVGGSPPGSPTISEGSLRGAGSGLVAFDKASGEVRWAVSDELASYASPIIREIGGRDLGLAFMRGGLIGFSPGEGSVEFSFPWRAKLHESVNASNPVVVGDRVFISESYGPGGAVLEIGEQGRVETVRRDADRRGTLRAHWATPIYHEGHLYGCHGSGSGDAELRAVDFESGALKWKKRGMGRTTAVLVDGKLIVLGEYGTLHVVAARPDRYEELATYEPAGEDGRPLLTHPAWNAPVPAAGRLYVRGKDRLVCFDLQK